MQKKMGISLIVLVITIIVMTILAGAIVLTLNNSGIIDKATAAVKQTNIATVREVAQMAWAEAYIDGARTQEELKAAVDNVLSQNKITEDMYEGYTLEVTTIGVSLEKIEYVNFIITMDNRERIGYDEEVEVLVIPATFYDETSRTWYKVTEIEASAFEGCENLVNVVIPDTVTNIGDYAFATCTSMVKIILPKGLQQIAHNLFVECDALVDVAIPEGVIEIGESAFTGPCMETITIPSTVKKIGVCAFTSFFLKNVIYVGTMEEWNAIDKDRWIDFYHDEWGGASSITVSCIDGDIIVEAE